MPLTLLGAYFQYCQRLPKLGHLLALLELSFLDWIPILACHSATDRQVTTKSGFTASVPLEVLMRLAHCV